MVPTVGQSRKGKTEGTVKKISSCQGSKGRMKKWNTEEF